MSWLTRLLNLFRRDRIARELEEEMSTHLEEALEQGRDPVEARRRLGSSLHHREQSRDFKLIAWLDALASDVVFGWRQINKHRTASATAILSLALAIGATTSAFRLIDAIFLRKLPVTDPDRLHVVVLNSINRDGLPEYRDDFDYPTFRQYRATLAGSADLVLLGGPSQQGAAFGSGDQIEQIYREYVSGNAFSVLGLQPALGRLIAPADDTTPGGHPVAVLSYSYWRQRFARDPGVVGKRFRMPGGIYEIIGVGPDGFTGTEPGGITDVFIPATMNVPALNADGWSWFRIWVRPKPGFTPEQIGQPLNAEFTLLLREQARHLDSDTPKQAIDRMLNQSISVIPAAMGISARQREYRRPLLILALLVTLVLLIACANVGNLLAAQAASRAREMALRVSIGAGQWRLIQLVLVESALLAGLASLLASLFSWWCTPLVVSMLAPPEDPVRLVLNPDWHVLGFGVLVAISVTLLFGLVPALRASGIKPIAALKGTADTHARRGLMDALVAAQVAFCVLVLFVAGLFVSTFQRLSSRPLGFAPQGLLAAGTMSRGKPQPAETWRQITQRAAEVPGVESAAYAAWSPLSGNHWISSVRARGRAAEPQAPYFLEISPGYFNTLRIGWIEGRDFRPGDVNPKLDANKLPQAGVGIVNEAFARTYFDGHSPVGKVIEVRKDRDTSVPLEIVGYVRDACYSTVREIIHPTVYVPFKSRGEAAIMIRTAADPRVLAPVLRREINRARSDMRVGNIHLQTALVNRQLISERLLATLSFFFAAVALVLAAIGLYGVLNYGVIRQRREIGIRIALGARSAHVIRRMTTGVFAVVLCGAAAGLFGGIACGRFVESLLYEVKPGDTTMIAAPIATLLAAALLAALPPAIRASRIDPAQTLRE